MLGSIHCSIVSFLVWHGMGVTRHCSDVAQNSSLAVWDGNVFISVNQFKHAVLCEMSSMDTAVYLL